MFSCSGLCGRILLHSILRPVKDMSVTLLPPKEPAPGEEAVRIEEVVRISDGGGNGNGGRNFEEHHYGPDENRGNDPERWATPFSAYRTAALFAVFSITSVFATLTHILASRWVHSKDWTPLILPHVLYFNTVILLISSLTIELARFSLSRGAFQRSVRWLWCTLLLGVGFVAGQAVAWKAIALRGLYLSSNPGSFFFYFLTGVHGLHLLGGMLALSYVIAFANRLARRGRQEMAVGTVAFYWHFMDALWLYLLVVLFTAVQG